METLGNFFYASLFPEKYYKSWDPKIHGPCNYLHSFYVAALIDKCERTKYYPIEMYQNGISKDMRSSVTGMMNDIIPSTPSDSATTSKRKNNRCVTFKFQMKKIC